MTPFDQNAREKGGGVIWIFGFSPFAEMQFRVILMTMSKTAIERKLDALMLSKANFSEAEVVYVLVEISKHFERDEVEGTVNPQNQSIDFIRFFRDWAVHGHIGNPKHAQRALEMYNTFGPNRAYDEMVKSLMAEISTSGVISIPAILQPSFIENLYKVIQDVPIYVAPATVRLTANDDRSIHIEPIP
jgi:hypothetical protein